LEAVAKSKKTLQAIQKADMMSSWELLQIMEKDDLEGVAFKGSSGGGG